MLRSTLPISLLALLATALATSELASDAASEDTTVPTQNYTCPTHLYNIQIVSHSPQIIYIPDFITESEAAHLRSISASTLSSSQIADETGQQHLASTRTSQSTSLASDPIVQCIESRALSFQGASVPRTHLEPLQAVHYDLGQKYSPHTDWFTSSTQTGPEFGGNRASSFFVYVHASDDIVGGGTQFPLVDPPHGEEWCRWVNCDAALGEGVTFRPVARNAVFWRNLVEEKGGKSGSKRKLRGDRRTLHAGLPVQRGEKLGMNIWTREAELGAEFRSEVVEA